MLALAATPADADCELPNLSKTMRGWKQARDPRGVVRRAQAAGASDTRGRFFVGRGLKWARRSALGYQPHSLAPKEETA